MLNIGFYQAHVAIRKKARSYGPQGYLKKNILLITWIFVIHVIEETAYCLWYGYAMKTDITYRPKCIEGI